MHLKEFTYQSDSGLYVPPSGVPEFTYSDGSEIEDYILWAVSNAKDKSSLSEELRSWIKDWPTRYHLSPSRANLLRPFSFLNKSAKVLEVGSGCGAITRYLGEVCGQVDAIEGSYRRAKITRERCSDLHNVNVYVANVFDVSFEKEYDIVSIIGVLEYAPTFCPEEVSTEECCAKLLKCITQALKDDGILILAIENKLGLKYWTGAKEDHSGRSFDGLYDYPHFPGLPLRPVTFSKNELYQLLLSVGFKSVQFYYPFPDYKLPNTLIRDSEELKRGELFLHNWIVTPFEDYSGYREYLLHEGLTLKSLHKAGLLGDFANSFLVLTSRGDLSHLIDETWIAKRFSVERKPCYATVTTLYCIPELKVVKNQICSDIYIPQGGLLSLKENVEQWYPGDLLIYELYKAVLDKEDPELRLKNLTISLNDYLIQNYGTQLCDAQGYPLLHGRAFDVVPWNIIVSGERWVEIDREWEYQGMLPADFVLYRGLYYFLTSQQPYLAQNNNIKLKEPDALVISLIRDVYPNYDEERHMKNKVWEGQLQDFVIALPFEVRIKQFQLQIESEQIEKQKVLNERDHFKAQIVEKEQRILELEQSFADLSSRVSIKEKKFLHEKERLETQVAEKERITAHLEQSINELKKQLIEKDNNLLMMRNSLGWFLIERYRRFADKIFPPGTKRRAIYELWQKALKTTITSGPVELYKKTKNWFIIKNKQRNVAKLKKVEINSEESIHASGGLYEEAYKHMLSVAKKERSKDYVPIQEHDISPSDIPVRLIAFYLPQFHPIPENDEWWGKGFTEWTNVSKAVPQFIGHYQPHLPGELGFYDLRVPEVQRRQVELAKKYGIYGFCFYYYWFNGKRLLWRPIEQFISDSEIDFPFCLCWANENWTRRWDGLDNEILIAQVHSEESDFAFIRDIEPILRHKRYIRINGRPLLIVYRPQLMPNPAATAKRWKEYCREAGIGDLYLVAAQTFGFYDPREVGFDAAVEFPPHNVNIPEINHTVQLLNPNFSGKIYRYTDVVEYVSNRPRPPYQLFKTVFPSWDNEPRRPGRGHIFAFSSPEAYKDWLTQACLFALEDPDPEKHIVFINAWNEWGEGAHLEPDRRFGYAYLQATADVLEQLSSSKPSVFIDHSILKDLGSVPATSEVAVILHLYYLDLWEEISTYLGNIKTSFDLYISIPWNAPPHFERIICSKFPQTIVLRTKNRGRDIAPFIELLDLVIKRNYHVALKIHSKKSLVRREGDLWKVEGEQWRKDMLIKLLGDSEKIMRIIRRLNGEERIGLIAPKNYIVPLASYLGENNMYLEKLTRRLEIMIDYNAPFSAGTMFWFKPQALVDLLKLELDYTMFEPEAGQVDGTLAHAIERLIGQIILAKGYKLVSDDEI
ncbi:Methyltransferase domain-containing protein [Caldanaerovirga acetigignens]|uniref:Methyltransferase domain-containing protein n=1 Tax=Caldanaerovirga acetigignens TaxID=447595 RepID=A0A1M7MA47_9FIRM|nr:glycoside hydrolase family 99-like domain-containing protein [Caldanaerovirga acetigignens]SHM87676.1 Methyltransferase domain-containing protein [Caldanaerovirga acetigignens]